MKSFFDRVKEPLLGGIAAGLLIAIGGSVYLAAADKVVGAVLFSVALLCICLKGYALFTGRVGYMAEDFSPIAWLRLAFCLLGNIIGTLLSGLLVRFALPSLGEAAEACVSAKLTVGPLPFLIRAFFCGILMYLAVSTYKEKGTLAGIFFCVPVFILSGFEHSVADLFYFGTALSYTGKSVLYLALAVLGNSLGGVTLPLLKRLVTLGDEKEKKE